MRSWLKALGGIVTGGLLALAGGEIALRGLIALELDNPFLVHLRAVRDAAGRAPVFRRSEDPVLEVELIPEARQGALRINAAGFRGPEVALRPAPGMTRVVVIGDSETFGRRLAEHEALPGALERALETLAGEPHEVVNFGHPGYNAEQVLHVLRTRVLAYAPSAIVYYYVFNDAEDGYVRLLTEPESGPLLLQGVADWVVDGLHSVRRIRASRDGRDIVSYYRDLHRSERFLRVRAAVAEMAALSTARGARFVVVIAPEIYGFEDFASYPYRDVHALLAGMGGPDTDVVDPLDALVSLGERPYDLWVRRDDPHKNARATRAIAEHAAAHLAGVSP